MLTRRKEKKSIDKERISNTDLVDNTTSYFKASSTCSGLATSTQTGSPVVLDARFNQGSPFSPTPSNALGRVLGFQIPALSIKTGSSSKPML